MAVDKLIDEIEGHMESILEDEAEPDNASEANPASSLLGKVYTTLREEQEQSKRREMALKAGAVIAQILMEFPRVRTSGSFEEAENLLKENDADAFGAWIMQVGNLLTEDAMRSLRDRRILQRMQEDQAAAMDVNVPRDPEPTARAAQGIADLMANRRVTINPHRARGVWDYAAAELGVERANIMQAQALQEAMRIPQARVIYDDLEANG